MVSRQRFVVVYELSMHFVVMMDYQTAPRSSPADSREKMLTKRCVTSSRISFGTSTPVVAELWTTLSCPDGSGDILELEL